MESFSLLVLDSRAIILHNSLSHHSSFCSSPNFFVCVPSQSDMHILAYLISIEHVNGKHWRSTKKGEYLGVPHLVQLWVYTNLVRVSFQIGLL